MREIRSMDCRFRFMLPPAGQRCLWRRCQSKATAERSPKPTFELSPTPGAMPPRFHKKRRTRKTTLLASTAYVSRAAGQRTCWRCKIFSRMPNSLSFNMLLILFRRRSVIRRRDFASLFLDYFSAMRYRCSIAYTMIFPGRLSRTSEERGCARAMRHDAERHFVERRHDAKMRVIPRKRNRCQCF